MTIAECLPQLLSDPNYQLLPPAAEAALQQLEQAAAAPLPGQLRDLYRLSNGIAEYMDLGAGVELVGYLVLPAEEAAGENRAVRLHPQSPTEATLLIFAHAYTDGGRFGFRVADLPAAQSAVYCWFPLEDELELVANSLPEFLLGWAGGQISI
ncbi:SMI1/KNR4 family protein [Hymenobacter gummosus]|uniref:SMI1/KNR4 family protein n=1 Tax=Hymenobacter gummosus TaxID=1776032 RepID=A0A431TW20_9BACT|nr:SMI1/KNR4 family protein [Hymenobacter gummosus]RTQ45600.1 SMI1/KNR4 family protein [Hymenobacter gummosus]